MTLVGLVPPRALLGVFVAAALAQGCKGLFDAALQALVGTAVPPAKRGQYTGLVELSWGGSSLVGLPVAGALLDADYRAMFLVLGAVQLLPAVALHFVRPLPAYVPTLHAPAPPPDAEDAQRGDSCTSDGDAGAAVPAPEASSEPEALMTWREVALHPEVQQIACSISVVVMCVDSATIDFGVWLQEGRGLDTSRVAAATLALGFADFGGELLVRLCVILCASPACRCC